MLGDGLKTGNKKKIFYEAAAADETDTTRQAIASQGIPDVTQSIIGCETSEVTNRVNRTIMNED